MDDNIWAQVALTTMLLQHEDQVAYMREDLFPRDTERVLRKTKDGLHEAQQKKAGLVAACLRGQWENGQRWVGSVEALAAIRSGITITSTDPLPTPGIIGFMVLPEPLLARDTHGKIHCIQAFSWGGYGTRRIAAAWAHERTHGALRRTAHEAAFQLRHVSFAQPANTAEEPQVSEDTAEMSLSDTDPHLESLAFRFALVLTQMVNTHALSVHQPEAMPKTKERYAVCAAKAVSAPSIERECVTVSATRTTSAGSQENLTQEVVQWALRPPLGGSRR